MQKYFSLERRVSLLPRENSFYLLLLWTRSERVARERTLGYIGILTTKSFIGNDNIVNYRNARS